MKSTALVCLGVMCALIVAGCSPEDRITFNVNTVSDSADPNPGDDVCGTARSCSLRAALEEAAAGDKRAITINVPGGTYLLALGELEVAGKIINLQGAGVDRTVVDAQQTSRVMNISSGLVTVADLTLQNGVSRGPGGGVRVESAVIAVLEDVVVQDNDGNFQGGGMYIEADANVLVTRAVIQHNYTGLGGGGGGGGIFNLGNLTITDSTFRNNKGGFSGGGIGHFSGRLRLTNSTVADNLGPRSGLVLGGPSRLDNVTVSGNHDLDEGTYRDRNGVGVSVSGRTLFRNVTVTDNGNTVASRNDDSGGVYVVSGAVLTLQNSLLAGNSGGDCKGALTSRGHNLIGDASLCTVSSASGDQLGTASAPIDAQLGNLSDNGGPTQTTRWSQAALRWMQARTSLWGRTRAPA